MRLLAGLPVVSPGAEELVQKPAEEDRWSARGRS